MIVTIGGALWLMGVTRRVQYSPPPLVSGQLFSTADRWMSAHVSKDWWRQTRSPTLESVPRSLQLRSRGVLIVFSLRKRVDVQNGARSVAVPAGDAIGVAVSDATPGRVVGEYLYVASLRRWRPWPPR